MAETVCKAQERFLQCSLEHCDAIMPSPGLLHIGRAAYLVWADPPNGGCTR